jgi:hypothetical protein
MLLCARSQHMGPLCPISRPKVGSHPRKAGMLRARGLGSHAVGGCRPFVWPGLYSGNPAKRNATE